MKNKSLSNKETEIVFVINTLHEGGAAKILSWLANHTINDYNKVSIVTFFSNETAIEIDKRINIIAMDKFKKTNRSSFFWRLSLIHDLRNIVLKQKPNLVCSFISDVNVTTILALAFSKIPIIIAERGDPFALSFMWKLFTKTLYKTSDFRIYQTSMARDFYEKKNTKESEIISNPYLKTGKALIHEGERNKVISSAGRFEHQKGFDILLKAFKKVNNVYPEYKLIIYGDGSLRESYNVLINDLNLTGKVEMPGYVSNVQEKIRKDKVFVLSSRFEGMPNALIEAMAIGVPTISTNCTPGGPAFLTNNGSRGMLVEVNDIEGIAEGIIKIISDEEYSKILSIRGQEVKDELDPELLYQKWKSVFDYILSTKI